MPDREGRAEMVEAIANGLQGNAKQQLHHLLLLVTGGDGVLNSLVDSCVEPEFLLPFARNLCLCR
jgi:hypothetical protein